MKNEARQVILITDGDEVAAQAVQTVATKVGGRCISRSSGNPTPLTGNEIVDQISIAQAEPVLVMFDDCGDAAIGDGERALQYVATHPSIQVLGAIAVASNTNHADGVHIDVAIDAYGNVLKQSVNKAGKVEAAIEAILFGDTVGVLEELDIPFVVGVGDIGKMGGHDDVQHGCPITYQAVKLILERSDVHGKHTGK